MAKLPESVLKAFLDGEQVMRHQPGLWNVIWSGQYIEFIFMRYGHGPKGIIGITLEPSTLKRWALDLHICTELQKVIKTWYMTTQRQLYLFIKEKAHLEPK